MAWNLLPTDYTDAVWSGLKKYTEVKNPDGTVSFKDVTIYTDKENSFFGANDANRMNEALNHLMSKVSPLFLNNAGAHNAIYRGESLGNTVTLDQYAATKAGTFEDLYIGDYWTINDINYRIAAFDYYLNTGNDKCTSHHVAIVPDTCLYDAQMHNTTSGKYESKDNTTIGAYTGSDMYTKNLETAKTTIKNAFGSHILSHEIFLSTTVTNGKVSKSAIRSSDVELMCGPMVYGSDTNPERRMEKSQLPLFLYEPSRISIGTDWWLRDVESSSDFVIISHNGTISYERVTYPLGVRPVFCIF